MKLYRILLVSICLHSYVSLQAQTLLTPEQAVTTALQKNYDIVLAKSEADIAKINNNKATAGMLPIINVTAGNVFNLNNINQKFTTGQEVKKNWVPVNSFTTGLNMNWTIFDGMRMFAAKDRLAALQSLSEMQLNDQIQNTIAQVLSVYYEIVRQKQLIKALNESLKITEERVFLSNKKLEVGYADKTPLLQAKVDLSSQKINILKQETQLQQSKVQLNQLLGRTANDLFDVIDTIEIKSALNALPTLDAIHQNNLLIKGANKNIEIAKLQHKEIKAKRMPQINFNTSYNFMQNNSKAGLQLFNRSYGPQLGVQASIPIFNGGMVKKELQVSAVNIAMKQIQVDQIKNSLDAQLQSAYNDFDYATKVLDLNEDNVKTAAENVQVTLERFRLSQSTSLEIKQAQSSYEDALYNVVLARYNAKIAEIALQKLNNALPK
ncbi:MAG TPA: TolC family protein [Chitinophagales bacterium]|nr:TolC family protein [Chitinophagales bacterium]HMW12545.1 TolC family protein [Chitinophagales bacterium]HMY23803.1 TolC family protein [Chitinophagales bacterium]HMZ33712.1 TolC family protein [Chitinophagales bacterium]HNC71885.1 TolC family protein [Chitinophagales bacterium]